MAPDESLAVDPVGVAVETIEQTRRFAGVPGLFWPACLEALARLASARLGVIVVRRPDDLSGWRRIAIWPPDTSGEGFLATIAQNLDEVGAECEQSGAALRQWQLKPGAAGAGLTVLAVRLRTDPSPERCLGLLVRDPAAKDGRAGDAEALVRLRLAADMPAIYQLQRTAQQATADVQHFASVIDVLVPLNRETRFLAAAMALANELASRHQCSRVSLGWLEKDYVRLKVMSHVERFERKMEAVRLLEMAMEEALDQDEEIILPPDSGATAVSREHAAFAQAQDARFMISLPLRGGDRPIAVLSCERNTEAFGETETRLLRLTCDMVTPRLRDLRERDRWFGARWIAALRRGLAKLVGVEHTWAKLVALLVIVLALVVCLVRVDYRVEAPFTLRAEDLAYVPAPFDGYIDEVLAEVGDRVEQGAHMLKLDTRELLLEEAAAAADQTRFVREAEKARADGALADMRVALALAEQASVQLDLVRHRLGQANVQTPVLGVVVEGDLKERIGAPVKRGDILFKVAALENMHPRLEIAENDIHEIRGDATGEIAFASQPQLKFPIRVERIDPAATPQEGKNVFLVRCAFECEPQEWWRPGMTGISKTNAGRRTLLWIFTHRTVDFLRLLLWW